MTRITSAGIWPDDLREDRFATTVARTDPAGCRVALLGMPDDLGVRMNGGRVGAAEGPYAFRSALARYGTKRPAFGRPSSGLRRRQRLGRAHPGRDP
jgi:hypothetical protein